MDMNIGINHYKDSAKQSWFSPRIVGGEIEPEWGHDGAIVG